MKIKYDAIVDALFCATRYSESSGEGGGVYEDDEGDYIRRDAANPATIQQMHADMVAMAEALEAVLAYGSMTGDEWVEEKVRAALAAASQDVAPVQNGHGQYQLVPIEVLDRFPEINMSNYGPDDVEALNEWGIELARTALPAQGAATAIKWENFPSYLIEHCEGDAITEEGLQRALASMLADPKYTAAPVQAVAPSDPMDTPLPCDVKVGGVTMKKGVKLRTLVSRMVRLQRAAIEHFRTTGYIPKDDAAPQAVARVKEGL